MNNDFYGNALGSIPPFLLKYLDLDILQRLKKVTYFCGMDYASKDIYDFSYKISRYEHSLNVAMLTYKFTKRKKDTLAGLFHDIATPVFSHVIDYMHQDYEKQEYTENKTLEILASSKALINFLKEDNLTFNDLDFKKYSIVDNMRPKMCMDRLDGIILTSLAWTKCLQKEDVPHIINDLEVYKLNEEEIGFKSLNIANLIINLNQEIDKYTHTKEDFYMMSLLAKITKYLIDNNYLEEKDLYIKNEEEVIFMINQNKEIDFKLKEMWEIFQNIKKEDIDTKINENLKKWDINPLVRSRRYSVYF